MSEKIKLPKGVYISGKKYIAKIRHNTKLIHLGTFNTPEEAEQAYLSKRQELGGQAYKTINRSKEDLNILDAFIYENGTLINKKTGFVYQECNTNSGYIAVAYNGQQVMAHRVIWAIHNGIIPDDLVIDHINGIKTDNRIENLRLATRAQNNANSIGSGKYLKGVTSRPNGKFQSSIQLKGIKITIGTFDSEIEAHKAYLNKAVELYGEFARLDE